jgi:hypothetical protein
MKVSARYGRGIIRPGSILSFSGIQNPQLPLLSWRHREWILWLDEVSGIEIINFENANACISRQEKASYSLCDQGTKVTRRQDKTSLFLLITGAILYPRYKTKIYYSFYTYWHISIYPGNAKNEFPKGRKFHLHQIKARYKVLPGTTYFPEQRNQ